jgi:hypothetical protein
MKIVLSALIAITLVSLSARAQDAPEIRVSEGKVSISAQAVPIGRLISLLDRAVGMTSTVKPELSNRTVSVRFTNLDLKDAVRKIFEGQPLNYFLIQGKGIRVTDLAASGTSSSSGTSLTSSSPSFIDSPINPAPAVPIGNAQAGPTNPTVPAQPNNPFGNAQQPATNAPAAATPGAAFVPGQLPPPIGASNPLVSPAPATAPVTGFPSTPAAAPQPTGPGAVGVTPGQIR